MLNLSNQRQNPYLFSRFPQIYIKPSNKHLFMPTQINPYIFKWPAQNNGFSKPLQTNLSIHNQQPMMTTTTQMQTNIQIKQTYRRANRVYNYVIK